MKNALRNLAAIVRGILDELTDQRAYQLHLDAHGVVHSPDEWRRFCDAQWLARSRRGRCC